MRSKALVFCLFMSGVRGLPHDMSATTINVPGDYTTIQAAIDSAAAGDTIKVSSGTYTGTGNRGIDADGKNVVITSVAGADSTILDAGSVDRHFLINSGEDTTFQIIGFTLKNGKKSSNYGGSIKIDDYWDGSSYVGASPTIKNCVFKDNSVYDWYYGGAIYIDKSSPRFKNCTFRDNTTEAYGGAVYITNSSSAPTFSGCTFVSNEAKNTAGEYRNSYGGAVYIGNGTPTFTDCEFDSNLVQSGDYSGNGGAVYISSFNNLAPIEPVKFSNCFFRGNTNSPDDYAYGGALYIQARAVLTNCVIAGNVAQAGGNNSSNGGGIFMSVSMYDGSSWVYGDVTIINSTIANNSATSSGTGSSYGGGIFVNGSSQNLTMFNTIIWGNNASYEPNLYDAGATMAADYNNIEGGSSETWFNPNSYDIDPQFTDSANNDFSLSAASVLIGAGASTYEGYSAPSEDILNNIRPNPSGSNPDIGAYENSLSTTPYPAQMTGLAGTAGDQKVSLSWPSSSESDISYYKVYKDTATGFSASAGTFVDSVSHPDTTYTVTGLTNTKTYYFRVSAVDTDGYEGLASAEASVVPVYVGPLWWVATDGSSSNEGSRNSPFANVQAAINAAAAGDTVMVKSGTYTGTGNRGIDADGKNVVITSVAGADSTTLDAGSIDRHFQINSGEDTTFQIIGFTLKNGKGSSNNGGSIRLDSYWNGSATVGSNPTIKNCVFKDNAVFDSYSGGAVSIDYSSVKFINCTFRGNSAEGYGGAVSIVSTSAPTFTGCTFIGNEAKNSAGEYRYTYGGAVYIQNGTPTFTDCAFDSNLAQSSDYGSNGGAVYIESFNNNETDPVMFTRCSFRWNSVTPDDGARGGAVATRARAQFVNCLVVGNQTTSGGSSASRGGGIFIGLYSQYNSSTQTYVTGDVVIINSTIANNTSTATGTGSTSGGGVYLNGSSQNLTMFNTIISGNSATNGTNLYDNGATLAADYNDIEGGSSETWFNPNSFDIDPRFTDASNNDFSLSDASPLIGGGASTYESYSAPTDDITGGSRPNPSTSSPDLGAYENSLDATPYPAQVKGVAATAKDQQVTLSWTANSESDISYYKIYKDTTSGFSASAATFVDSASHPDTTYTITGLTNKKTYYFLVSAVDADRYEGVASAETYAIPVYSGPVWWVATTGSDLTSEGSQNAQFKSLSKALTQASSGDTIKVSKGTYSGLANRGLDANGKNIVIMSVDGADSTTLDAGGVDRHFQINSGEDSTFQIIGFTLQNGKSSSNGGSIYMGTYWDGSSNVGVSPIIKNCEFKDNKVLDWSYGGAVYIGNSSPQFRSCTFRENSSESNGGAIYISGSLSAPQFSSCKIISNTISNEAGDYREAYGGGVYVSSGTPVFTDCDFNYNTISSADYGAYGGAVYVGYFNNLSPVDPVKFERCTFKGNSVSPDDNAYGGGLDLRARTVLSSCLIAGNEAQGGSSNSGSGSGVYISLSSYYNSTTKTYETGEVRMINCTIADNSASSSGTGSGNGGGLYLSGSDQNLVMFNTVIWGNTADNDASVRDNSASITSDYNDIEGGSSLSWTGSNSLAKDPGFTDASGGDYTLSIASDLIGAGTPTYESYNAPSKDVAGNDRPSPSGSSPDIGAYESTYASSPYPAPPSNLTATAGNAQVTLHWDAHTETDVSTYGIYYGTSANPTVKQADVSGRTTDSTVVTGLSNNVVYYFRITATDSSNYESDYSDTASATPQFTGSTIYVDGSLSSYTNPDGSSSDPFQSIQDAIDASTTTDGKRILVKAGTYTGSGSTSKPVIDLKGKNVILEAESGPDSTTIDAGGSRTALDLDSDNNEYSGYANGSTKFIGFTFTNGDDDKPLINIDGPESYYSSNSWDITFENCRFTNTMADFDNYEPIINIDQSNTVFESCTFRALKMEVDGSYSYAPIKLEGSSNSYWDGSSWTQDTTVYKPQFKNCVIAGNSNGLSNSAANNQGWQFWGGAVYVGYGAVPYFENTRIDSNAVDFGEPSDYAGAQARGGAIYIAAMYDNGPPLKFVNCSISHNEVKGHEPYGGGIYSEYGQTQFINCLIVDNEAHAAYSNIYNNSNTSGGGLYYNVGNSGSENSNYSSKDPQLLIVNCTIADNVVTPWAGNGSEAGAGIYRSSSSYPVLMFNSIVYNNSITGSSVYSNMNLSTSWSSWGSSESLIDFSLIQYAGDAGVSENDVTEFDPKFTGSGSYTLTTASKAIGAGTSSYESVIAPDYDYNNRYRPQPHGSSPDLGAFENTLSSSPYPDEPKSLAVTDENDSTVTLSWTANSEEDLAKYRIYTGTTSPAATLTDSASATATSKAVKNLINQTPYYFRITAVDADGYESDYSSEVSGKPEYKGPVWYVDDDASGTKDGSPARPYREIDDALINNSLFTAGDTVMLVPGTYDRSGDRGLSAPSYSFVLTSQKGADSTIIELGTGTQLDPRYRFMKFENGADTTSQIIGLTIQHGGGNNNDDNGGAIRLTSFWDPLMQANVGASPKFKDCVFKDNEVEQNQWGGNLQGGAVYINGSSPVFENCTFSGNKAPEQGGAIYISDSESRPQYIGCTFENNQTTNNNGYEQGAAIYSSYATELLFERCKFIGNTSNGYGGAIYLEYWNSEEKWLVIRNSLFAENSALNDGGAINIASNSNTVKLLLEHVTITDNTISGTGGAGLVFNDAFIVNSIIWNNSMTGNSPISSGSGDIEILYSLVEKGDQMSGYDFGSGLLIDPRFTDPDNDDYSISLASFAIGAGTDEYEDPITEEDVSISGVDLAGNDRVQPSGTAPDMGAYEHSSSLSPYPDPPVNFSVTSQHVSVDLTWSFPAAEDVTRYYIYQSGETDSTAFTRVDSLAGRDSTSATIAGLTNGDKYWFYITAVDTADYESVGSGTVSATPAYKGPVWYVDGDNGSNSGEGSPGEPARDIQDAIDLAAAGDTVMVLPGTYDRPDDQELTFSDVSGNAKNIVLMSSAGADSTVLDGEGNKRLFDITHGTDTTLQIIGFTITNGGEDDGMGNAIKVEGQSYWDNNTNQDINIPSGATFKDCIIKENGTAVSPPDNYKDPPVIYLNRATVRFEDCVIENNHVSQSEYSGEGAAIWGGEGSNVTLERTKILNNSLSANSGDANGAGIYMNWSDDNILTLINSVIAKNTATAGSFNNSRGAGIIVRGGTATIINSTIVENENAGNQTDAGAGIYLTHSGESSALSVFNSIIYGNMPFNDQLYIDSDDEHFVSYSIIQGSDPNDFEDGVFEADPEFADTTYALHARSPAIGAGAEESEDTEGDAIYVPVNDLAGNLRPDPSGSNPDLGAYESELATTPYPSPPKNLTAEGFHQSVELSWTPSDSADVVKYFVYQSQDSLTFTFVDTVAGQYANRATIDGLTNDQLVYFQVTSVDATDLESLPSGTSAEPHYLGPVWYVDDDGSSSGEGSPEEPAGNIRDMIEKAADRDTIMLMPGEYTGSKNRNLDFQYNMVTGVKNLVLMSAYGPDTTIIDLDGNDFIDFMNNEDNSSKIIGLTIKNSNSGAVDIWYSSPEIDNCIFLDNSNNENGGAINIGGTNGGIVSITNTLFDGNSIQVGTGNRGGAIMLGTDDSKAYVENCIFYNNSADEMGGAINQDNSSHLVIVQSLFVNNTTNRSWGAGGVNSFAGIYSGNTTIINSIFSGNTNTSGSSESDVSTSGYVMDIDHCILQSNSSQVFNYGENYAFDPFINDPANGDFSLNEFSPAIGKGTGTYYNILEDADLPAPDADFFGNARPYPAGSSPDIGPIEHTNWEQRRLVYYVDDGNGDDNNDGLSTGSALKTIQAALDGSGIRDTLELAAGTYSGAGNRNLSMVGVTRVLRSAAGADSTIIDCGNLDRAFVFENSESDSVLISGITIMNGSGDNGGAVYINGADPVFEGVIFQDNSVSGSGGAVYANDSYADFTNCVFRQNHAGESAAIHVASGELTVDFCTAVGNQGDDQVGFSGEINISNSILWYNSPAGVDVTIIYSDVMGGNDGVGNYNGRPGFIDGSDGDFRLQDWSPVIGRASNIYGVAFDIEGNARADSLPDMGAYENSLSEAGAYTARDWYVSTAGDDSTEGGGTAGSPFNSVQRAVNHAIYDDRVLIESGTYAESVDNWGKDIAIIGGGALPDYVTIDGSFEITGGTPSLSNLRLTNDNNDALQVNDGTADLSYLLLSDAGNSAGVSVNDSASATISNLTIYGNATGVYENTSGSVSVTNSIIWGNTASTYGTPAIIYSTVEGGYTGTGNISSDPLFVDAANSDYSLNIQSPAIDTGDPAETYDSDSTVVDMGAFPLIREFLAGTSTGNVDISSGGSVVITQDYTLDEGDTISIDPGATVYFEPGVSLTIEGVLAASGVAGSPIAFQCTNPDSTYGGVYVNVSTSGSRTAPVYAYMLITDVHADSIPFSISGDATLSHVTIAGNGNATTSIQLRDNSTLTVNHTITEGYYSGSGSLSSTNYYYNSTDQFVDYANGDYTLLSSAAAIDADTSGDYTDPDYTFADAGSFYHDQSGYTSDSIAVLYPLEGDTVLVSPDSSSAAGSGLAVEVQVFNTIGHYMTNPQVDWGEYEPIMGSFPVTSTTTSDFRGRASNTFHTTTTAGDLNSYTVDVSATTAHSGYFKVVPGAPDSVWVNEQDDMNMTQLDELTFNANIYDQFANLVSDGETVTWSVVPVVGNGDGYTLSASTSATSSGSVSVTLSTDPTGNTLSVGDQVQVKAASGTGTHMSALITIIPDDIYNLSLADQFTEAQMDVSADTAYIDFWTALIDTFDNPLENVEVFWDVVLGHDTGESLNASSSFTDANGFANVTLSTNMVAWTEYQVRCWVTADALFSTFFGGGDRLTSLDVSGSTGASSRSDNISGQLRGKSGKGLSTDIQNAIQSGPIVNTAQNTGRFVPVQVQTSTVNVSTLNREAVYDLDDTTAVVMVWPGATSTVDLPQDSVDVLLEDEFTITLDAFDQFGNLVRDGTSAGWEIEPTTSNVTILSYDDTTGDGQASIQLQIASDAAWDFNFKVVATVENIESESGTYHVDDVVAPAKVSVLWIDPPEWTSNNNFSLGWSNPAEHAGVAGAHYRIDDGTDVFVEGQGIEGLTDVALPANSASTISVWLEDNAGNEEENNANTITAKWDDIQPEAFILTSPLDAWYNFTNYRFEWNASSDATAGLDHYNCVLDGSDAYEIHPDSTGFNLPSSLAAGDHSWTVFAYDSSGNFTEASNPQTIHVDFTAPAIGHNPVLEATSNTTLTINSNFTDGESGIAVAELYYRKGGEMNWESPIDMSTLSTYQIASSFVTSTGVEYYLIAVDVAGNETQKPDQGYYSVSVTIPGDGLSSTDLWATGIPSGTSVSNYQLISIPGRAADNTPSNILVDDLGAYDNTLWRFYTYSSSAWKEFAGISTISPGTGYFLIVKDGGRNITTGQTRTVETNADFTINLSSGDWTMLGNPYDFSIPLDNVYTNDSMSVAGDPNFYTWNGEWVQASKLEPWRGYIYKSATASKLNISPRKNSTRTLAKQNVDDGILEENEWLVDIHARNGSIYDRGNQVGILSDASDTYDPYDAFEPPLPPGGVSLRIDNRDWPELGDIYTRDIRSVSEEGQYWDIEVIAGEAPANVTLTFKGVDDIPMDFDVFVVDLTLRIAKNLRWESDYRYGVASKNSSHELRFLAGSKDFLEQNSEGIDLYPSAFKLSQNFPNPFNAKTSILISLEDDAFIDLAVYNILGEEVLSLAAREHFPAGYYNFIWNGRNRRGDMVASGVYLYRARVTSLAGKVFLNRTLKMILVK